MVYKKSILTKILSNGMKMEIAVVKNDETYQAGLYINGRFIPGPQLPEPLNPAKGEITHWMGNKPSVGLTTEENEKIRYDVELENSVLKHRASQS